jgi:hypothetical protein
VVKAGKKRVESGEQRVVKAKRRPVLDPITILAPITPPPITPIKL